MVSAGQATNHPLTRPRSRGGTLSLTGGEGWGAGEVHGEGAWFSEVSLGRNLALRISRTHREIALESSSRTAQLPPDAPSVSGPAGAPRPAAPSNLPRAAGPTPATGRTAVRERKTSTHSRTDGHRPGVCRLPRSFAPN